MRNRALPITLITIGIIILVLVAAIYMFIVSGAAYALLIPNPSAPEIQHGEFPFTLEYELDGEMVKIEDTIVCEYDGVVRNGTPKRNWKSSLKNGQEFITLLNCESLNIKNKDGEKIIELYFYFGTGAYYMGDKYNSFCRVEQSMDYICYIYQNKNKEVRHDSLSADEAYEKFGIRLISWECAPPIENSFK